MATDPLEPVVDAAAIAGLLADADRRRVVAALVLGASTLDDVRSRTGLDTRAAVTALSRLVDAELVIQADDRHWFLVEEAFREAAIHAAPDQPDEHADVPPDTARVLRAFVRDGHLLAIPVQYGKRRIILDLLAQEFEPGQRYRERQVNAMLRRWHPDTAALRRYLVDDGFLDREAGEYWRRGRHLRRTAARRLTPAGGIRCRNGPSAEPVVADWVPSAWWPRTTRPSAWLARPRPPRSGGPTSLGPVASTPIATSTPAPSDAVRSSGRCRTSTRRGGCSATPAGAAAMTTTRFCERPRPRHRAPEVPVPLGATASTSTSKTNQPSTGPPG